MASTFTSDKAASTVQARTGLEVIPVYAEYELTAALVDDDVIQMVKVPEGARVLEVILTTDDLDTDASPALALNVGDGSDPNRYIAASTIGQTGGTVRMGQGIVTSTSSHTYAADDTIDIHVETAPATGAATGTLCLTVLYTMQT